MSITDEKHQGNSIHMVNMKMELALKYFISFYARLDTD